jgi:hypothetical protein
MSHFNLVIVALGPRIEIDIDLCVEEDKPLAAAELHCRPAPAFAICAKISLSRVPQGKDPAEAETNPRELQLCHSHLGITTAISTHPTANLVSILSFTMFKSSNEDPAFTAARVRERKCEDPP